MSLCFNNKNVRKIHIDNMMRIFFVFLFVFISTNVFAVEFTSNVQIPKIIHYVWVGSEDLPEKVEECIASWKKYQPDFQIKRWDERNCDINSNIFVKEAYKKKKYDFVSDYCRLVALEEGGVYFDTDMLLKAPIAPLLDEPLVLTLQRKKDLSAGFIAVTPNHPFVSALKKYYESLSGFSGGRAPSIWTLHFLDLYKTSASVGRQKGEYSIIAPNILMYDFGGGENIAEHLFGAGSADVQKSRFYNGFRRLFLEEFALYIPSERKYFIFKNDSEGYFYDAENKKAFSVQKYDKIQ